MPGLSVLQTAALVDELESATKLTELGVGELHRISSSNDYYHLPMQLLSQGLERFLKLTYAMAAFGATGALPSTSHMRRQYGHGLIRITDDLIQMVGGSNAYVRRPAIRDDLQFMRSDVDLRMVLDLLGDFGRSTRYHRLAEFLDPDSIDDASDPYRRWEELEFEIIRRRSDWLDRLGSTIDTDRLHSEAATYIAGLIDRLSRAIARMWTLGALPDEARRYSGLLKPFLFLRDEDLGVRRS